MTAESRPGEQEPAGRGEVTGKAVEAVGTASAKAQSLNSQGKLAWLDPSESRGKWEMKSEGVTGTRYPGLQEPLILSLWPHEGSMRTAGLPAVLYIQLGYC